MSKFTYTFYLLITYVCQSFSRAVSESDLECYNTCQQYHRHCLRSPDECGLCLPGYAIVVDPSQPSGSCLRETVDSSGVDGRSEVNLIEDMIVKRNRLQGANHVVNLDVRDVASPASLGGGSTTTAPIGSQHPQDSHYDVVNDAVFIVVITACCVAALTGFIVAAVCWYRLQKSVKAASEVEYPAYGTMTSSDRPPRVSGDRKLAHSAQMYHYQHQKQQMLELERAQNGVNKSGSEVSSDDEQHDEQYTIYECPGLATTGEMEVRNPLYSESPLPPGQPPTNGPPQPDAHP